VSVVSQSRTRMRTSVEHAQPTTERDWVEWHQKYDDEGSLHQLRLVVVRDCILEVLDRTAGNLDVVSMCAGQGRDLIGALAHHPSRARVSARLVELDPRNAAIAHQEACAVGLTNVGVVVADAGVTNAYLGAVPAHLILVCGVFGNIDAADTARTIRALPQLCAPDATVIWTHGRRRPRPFARKWGHAIKTRRLPRRSLLPRIRRWFREADFATTSFEQVAREPGGASFCVGTHRFGGATAAIQPGTRLFTFVGPGALKR
jgi:hypothetical protein